MGPQGVLVMAVSIAGVMAFIPHGSIGVKEHMLTEALLREVVERMGKDFNDAASTYLEFPNERQVALMSRANKDLEQEQLDYDSLIDGNPSPSLRDQEYLQHSSLWGHQYVSGGAGEGEQRLQPLGLIPNRQLIKTDAILPAYCNPPNPCPVGFTEDQGCINDFENTAAFSREYQLSQRCMCDGEHMFSCPPENPSDIKMRFPNHHKNLVAKKYKDDVENPYLQGERLPIAAKKGFDVQIPLLDIGLPHFAPDGSALRCPHPALTIDLSQVVGPSGWRASYTKLAKTRSPLQILSFSLAIGPAPYVTGTWPFQLADLRRAKSKAAK